MSDFNQNNDDEEYEAVSDRFDELLDEAAFEEMDD